MGGDERENEGRRRSISKSPKKRLEKIIEAEELSVEKAKGKPGVMGETIMAKVLSTRALDVFKVRHMVEKGKLTQE